MNQPEVIRAFQEYMIVNHNAKSASGGRELTKRCHLCGDSRDVNARHMYMGINNQSNLLVYNCFKCNGSGMVNHKFFRDMGDYNASDIGAICTSYNNEVLNIPGNKLVKNIENFKFVNPRLYVSPHTGSQWKLDYINDRLGTSLTFDEACKKKIIFNLYDFLNANKIENLTRYRDIADQIDKYFVGFLSLDNSYINFRRLVPEGQLNKSVDKRYINYNVFGKVDNTQRYYFLPQQINTLKDRKSVV